MEVEERMAVEQEQVPGGLLATHTFLTGPNFPKASSKSYLGNTTHKSAEFSGGIPRRSLVVVSSYLLASSCRPPT